MADNSLLPVVVGGLLTMGGVAISGGITFFVHWLDRSEEKRKRGADKFEELVKSIYEFDEWLNMKEADMAFGQKIKLDISPFAKIDFRGVFSGFHEKDFRTSGSIHRLYELDGANWTEKIEG